MYPHSEVKVDLLRKYLEMYLHVLSNTHNKRTIYIFDLFCGPGLHDNNGVGSPLVMLNEITKVSKSNKNISYKCLFNDKEKDKIEKLKKYVSESNNYSEITDINYSHIDYRVLIPDIISQIQAHPNLDKAFVFIDPYEYKDIRMSDIKSLLCNGQTEVLLFLPTQFMFRFEANGTPESLKSFIKELVPIKKWPKSSTGIDFIENLKDYFKAYLGKTFYVDTFIIKREAGQYFCLFFFTSNIFGFERMLEAKWKIDKDEGRGWSFERSYNLFLDEKSSGTLKFENELQNYILNPRTNKEVYEFTLHKSHLPLHANDVLRHLQNSELLSVLTNTGQPVRKNAFYLDHKPKKQITIQLK